VSTRCCTWPGAVDRLDAPHAAASESQPGRCAHGECECRLASYGQPGLPSRQDHASTQQTTRNMRRGRRRPGHFVAAQWLAPPGGGRPGPRARPVRRASQAHISLGCNKAHGSCQRQRQPELRVAAHGPGRVTRVRPSELLARTWHAAAEGRWDPEETRSSNRDARASPGRCPCALRARSPNGPFGQKNRTRTTSRWAIEVGLMVLGSSVIEQVKVTLSIIPAVAWARASLPAQPLA
jgi:hypothetical protein